MRPYESPALWTREDEDHVQRVQPRRGVCSRPLASPAGYSLARPTATGERRLSSSVREFPYLFSPRRVVKALGHQSPRRPVFGSPLPLSTRSYANSSRPLPPSSCTASGYTTTMGSPRTQRSTPRRSVVVLAVVAAAATVMVAAAAVPGGQPYPTGREPLLSPKEIVAAPAPPGVACGKRMPNTNHSLDCGVGEGRGVPEGAVVLKPMAGSGGGGGCPPTTLLFLHGQSTAPLVDYLPLMTIFARLPAAAGVRMVMPLAPHHPFVRVAAANGSESGAFAWYNLYQPPTEGIAATIAATTDAERVAVAAAHPWAVDSLGLVLSVSRLVRIVATEAAAGRRVVVIGHSLGCGMSLHLAAVLARAGLPGLSDRLGSFLAVSGLLPLADLHVAGAIATTTAPPVVLLHGEADETIPAAAGRLAAAVWTAGGGGARYRGVSGAGHSDVLLSSAMAEEATAVLAGGCARA